VPPGENLWGQAGSWKSRTQQPSPELIKLATGSQAAAAAAAGATVVARVVAAAAAAAAVCVITDRHQLPPPQPLNALCGLSDLEADS
jgi:hypothetical protein